MELTIDQALNKGIEAHEAGQVQEADRLYTAILKAQPKHPDANHNMGVLAVGVGKVQESLPFFKTALEANFSTAQFWLSYIDALIKLKRLADAKAMLDQAKEKGAKGDGFDSLEQQLKAANSVLNEAIPVSEAVELNQSNILDTLKLDQAIKLANKKSKEGSSEESRRIYKDVLTKFPKNKKALDGIRALSGGPVGKTSKVQDPPQKQLQPLINLYNQRQFQQALATVSELLQQFSNSIILYNIQGAANAGLGFLDAAVESYKQALSIKPDYAEAYNNMGNALKDQSKLEEAIGVYKKALSIKPDNAEAYNNIGNVFREQGKLEEAVEAYNKALALKPDYADAYNNMGIVLQDQGKLEKAIEAYNKALALKPDYADVCNNMGVALQDQGKIEEAIEAYNNALALKPDYAEPYINMGIALQEQGKLEEAIEAHTNALALKPDNAEAHAKLAVCLSSYLLQRYNTDRALHNVKIDTFISVEEQKLRAKISKSAYWFVDIPRTSSTTIKSLIFTELGWPFGKSANFVGKGKKIETSLLISDHTPAFLAERIIGTGLWQTLDTFTVVRNPYDWSISLWHYTMKYDSLGLNNKNFKNFLVSFSEKLKGDILERPFFPTSYKQSDYIINSKGEFLVKHVLKFEEKETIKRWLSSIGIANYSKRKLVETGSSTYTMDRSDKKEVERIFEQDFNLLGY